MGMECAGGRGGGAGFWLLAAAEAEPVACDACRVSSALGVV